MDSKSIEKSLLFEITDEHSGARLDKVLTSVSDISTRSRASFLIDQGLVSSGGKILKASYKVQTGDRIDILIPSRQESTFSPYDLNLDIVYEDSDLIVVNKPSGLVVHPAAGHEQDTLVNALIHHAKDLSMKFGEDRPGIVHRLDKETSGLLVIAKNDYTHESLALQFKERSTHRIYWALCLGTVNNLEGTFRSFLARHPVDRKRYASVRDQNNKIITDEKLDDAGKWAVTHYKVLSRKGGLSYLQLKLETGRTHQIRVHLSEAGLPIAGDALYGAQRKVKLIESKTIREEVANLDRFLLHAAELGFTHPRTEKRLTFAVPWPLEISSLLERWGIKNGV